MRVGLFTDTYIPFINGVSSSVFTLKCELEKNGHQVFIITTNPENNYIEFYDGVLRLPGLLLKKLYGYRLSWVYSGRAMKYIKKMNLDIIHSHSEYGIGIFGKISASKLNVPLVYTYHTMYEDYTHYITKGHFDFFATRLVYRLSKYYGSTCTELISPSLKTKEALRRYGVEKFINVIPTGIDLNKFEPNHSTKEAILAKRKELNIDEDTFVFIFLGRIAPEKNVGLILQGFQKLLRRAKRKVLLLIVGDGPAKMELELQAANLQIADKVIFTGKVMLDKVPIYYHIADVFACASVSETQGLTYIEAMASGLPVLACYDKNLDEILANGKTGYYFSSPETFTDRAVDILEFSQEKKQEMKDFCLKQAEKFSSDTFYQQIMEVYQRALRAKW